MSFPVEPVIGPDVLITMPDGVKVVHREKGGWRIEGGPFDGCVIIDMDKVERPEPAGRGRRVLITINGIKHNGEPFRLEYSHRVSQI